jgi:hypothetical protein
MYLLNSFESVQSHPILILAFVVYGRILFLITGIHLQKEDNWERKKTIPTH